ncbi:tubulin polymerization-promoting protein family member 2-like isoform X1 [Mercenaria mercenaria]|uniref:tubulin polymerization-promoting protein family member 2-like isoform X1 n=1 Tax=Mercenaria mercenaria TaxID=6596 RepID=UPI00234F5931|nr:tubulin polymerization-promoting protein family member 2-like isoform X1 [Mercenaria mercenaria]XP_053390059.1 tubulin polymerization-promoting protein family member 2-like isoform X1 [Mercenaria mercenaria]
MEDVDDDIVEKFENFCTLSGSTDKTHMNPKANGKLVKDCFESHYKKYDVKAICDASVFPALKEKGKPHMTVNKVTVNSYLNKTAHEIAKKKTKNPKIAEKDDEVKIIKADLCKWMKAETPHIKQIKQSATGNVQGLTDTTKYTGSHKLRLDEAGKGRGKVGRSDEGKKSGYVASYKGKEHSKKGRTKIEHV